MMEPLRRSRVTFYKFVLCSTCVLFLLGSLGMVGAVYYYGNDLPSRLDLASNYKPPVVSTVYDVQGRPIGDSITKGEWSLH